MKYKKKPVIIEALQWSGTNHEEIKSFIPSNLFVFDPPDKLLILTLEGTHEASLNDYIIKGVKGEFYPCKPDIFEMTYEKVQD